MSCIPACLRQRTLAEVARDELREHQLAAMRSLINAAHGRAQTARFNIMAEYHRECISILNAYASVTAPAPALGDPGHTHYRSVPDGTDF